MMISGDLLNGLTNVAAATHARLIGEIGLLATLATYLATVLLIGLVIWRLLKLALSILFRVALPATGVALLGAWLLPISFTHLLPVAAVVFAALLLVRG